MHYYVNVSQTKKKYFATTRCLLWVVGSTSISLPASTHTSHHSNQYRNRLKRFLWAIKRSVEYKIPKQSLYDASFLPVSSFMRYSLIVFCTYCLALGSAKHDDIKLQDAILAGDNERWQINKQINEPN